MQRRKSSCWSRPARPGGEARAELAAWVPDHPLPHLSFSLGRLPSQGVRRLSPARGRLATHEPGSELSPGTLSLRG